MTRRIILLCQTFPSLSETCILSQVAGLADALTSVVAEKVDWNLAGELHVSQTLHSLEPRWPRPGKLHQPWLKLRWAVQRRRPGQAVGWPPDVQDRFRGLLERERPDVVLIEYGHIAAAAYPALAKTGVPYVIHFHGVDASAQLAHDDYKAALGVILPRAKGIIVVSRSMRARLEEVVPGVSIELLPCGVAVPSELPERPITEDRCRVLAVGRLVEKKAPLELIEAVVQAGALASVPITLDLVGGGPLLEPVHEQVERLGVRNCVTVHGPQHHVFVKQLLRHADLFAQHSVVAPNGDREGCPATILEAAAEGLPVVATRHEGICDSVIEGETGFLVAEHDVAGMAERIAHLADRPGLRRRMGAAAHRHAVENFTTARYLSRLREVLGMTCSEEIKRI
jgi:glycosyltransferase involved in cell wall biosynthesis